MATSTADPHQIDLKRDRLVIIASSLGTIFEWYDFFVYGTLAVLIGKLFFPESSDTAAFLMALATFGVGFGVRPIGAALFGHLGDKGGVFEDRGKIGHSDPLLQQRVTCVNTAATSGKVWRIAATTFLGGASFLGIQVFLETCQFVFDDFGIVTLSGQESRKSCCFACGLSCTSTFFDDARYHVEHESAGFVFLGRRESCAC